MISIERPPVDEGAAPLEVSRQQAEFSDSFNASTWEVTFSKVEDEVVNPRSGANFQWERLTNLRGRRTLVYSFSLSGTEPRYLLGAKSGKLWFPFSDAIGQHGSVYVDSSSRRVTRIFCETDAIPAGQAFVRASVLLDFAFAAVNGEPFLLPIRAVKRVDSKRVAARYESELRLDRKKVRP